MEICTVGGFEQVGKNMTAVKYGEDVVIFDAGVHLPAIIELQGKNNQAHSEKDLRNAKAIPNDLVLDKMGWILHPVEYPAFVSQSFIILFPKPPVCILFY